MASRQILLLSDSSQVEAAQSLGMDKYYVLATFDALKADPAQQYLCWANGIDQSELAQDLANLTGKPVSLLAGHKQPSDFKAISEVSAYSRENKRLVEPQNSEPQTQQSTDEKTPPLMPVTDGSEQNDRALAGGGGRLPVTDSQESPYRERELTALSPVSAPQASVVVADVRDNPDHPRAPSSRTDPGIGVLPTLSLPAGAEPNGMPPAFLGPVESYGMFYGKRQNHDDAVQHEWPEPLDITKTVYFAKPFPLALAPTALQPFLASVAERKGVSTCIPFIGAMAAICGVAKDSIQLQVKLNDTGWRESARGWFVVVGDSSSGKTPGLLGPISAIQKMNEHEHEKNFAKIQDWKFKQDQYDIAYKKAVSDPNGQRPVAPEKPFLRHLMINKFNEEGLRDILVEEENGTLVYRDEISGTVGELDRYASKADAGGREDMLEGYNGGPRVIGRAGKQIRIRNWSFCLVGGITPDAIRKYAGKLEKDGFLQRMFMGIARQKVEDVDEPMPEDISEGYKSLLKTIFDMPAVLVTMEPDAYRIFQDFMDKVRALIKYEENGALAAHLGKWEGLAPRMMLAYLIVDKASQGQFLQSNDKVTAHIAQQVCDLFLKWELSQLEEFWNAIMGEKKEKHFSITIAKYLLAHDELTELSYSAHVYKQHWKALDKMQPWEIRNAMTLLWDAGWIVPKGLKKNGMGIPSFWMINPRLKSFFAEERAEEKEARKLKRANLMEMYAAADERKGRDSASDSER